jgi:hypothetical protein
VREKSTQGSARYNLVNAARTPPTSASRANAAAIASTIHPMDGRTLSRSARPLALNIKLFQSALAAISSRARDRSGFSMNSSTVRDPSGNNRPGTM